MDITRKTVGEITVMEIVGDIDGGTAPTVQGQITALESSIAKIILDMSGVGYMSSAGLRVLLVVYRTVVGQGRQVVLVGLSEELQDTMSMTGFMDFFAHYATLDEGLAALNQEA